MRRRALGLTLATGLLTAGLAVGAPTAAQPPPARGVTDDTITVGLLRLRLTAGAPAEAALGVRALPAAGEDYWEVVQSQLNAQGGVAGRRIESVYHDIELTEAPAEADRFLREACEAFTRRHEVFAVLDGWYVKNEEWVRCLSDAGVVLISGNYSEVDQELIDQSLYVDMNTLSLDRMAELLVGRFHERGFFDGGTVGLVRRDAGPWERATTRSLKPALAARGIHLAHEAVLVSPEDNQRAVAELHAAGVDRLLVFLQGGPLILLNGSRGFLTEAAQQGYFPRLGLSSQDDLPTLADTLLPTQLDGAIAQGWTPYGDVPETRDDLDPPGREDCRARLGNPHGDGHRERDWAAMHACDWGAMLALAGHLAADQLTAPRFVEAVGQLGDGFRSAVAYQTAFAPDRRDGVVAHRDLAYDMVCHCFHYVTPLQLFDPPPPPPVPAPAPPPSPPPPPSTPAPAVEVAQVPPPAPPAHPPIVQPAQPVPPPSAVAPVAEPASAGATVAQGTVVAAQESAVANPAVVPAVADPEPATRYASSRLSAPAGSTAVWLLLALGVAVGTGGLAAGCTSRRLAYAWATKRR